MESQAASLRTAIAKSKEGTARWRCPAHLRSEILTYTRERREAGVSLKSIGRELGVSENSLSRWQQAMDGGGTGSLLPVRVTDDDQESAGRSVVVVTPRGYRVEGLTVASAASLLARL